MAETTSNDGETARLRDAEAWVFDLDNTLYSASCDLFAQIDVRMKTYIADFLGLDADSAYILQKRYFHEYGTSLRGLMRVHGMDPTPFLDHVHDIDLTPVAPSPQLDAALAALPGRKLIFTNATTRHAERVTDRLGVGHHFDGVFDIVATDYVPKPAPEIYRTLVDLHDLDPGATVMVEDMARNLEPAAALGMTTVWVRTGSAWGSEGADDGYVDHVVDDVADWLSEVTAETRAGR